MKIGKQRTKDETYSVEYEFPLTEWHKRSLLDLTYAKYVLREKFGMKIMDLTNEDLAQPYVAKLIKEFHKREKEL